LSRAELLRFGIDVARISIWFVLLTVIFIPLERLFAVDRKRIWRREFAIDLAWYFGNGLITTVILATLIGLLAACAQRIVPPFLIGLPLWQRMLATFVVGEFGFYWGHRWSHEVPLLWRFHSIHHTAEDVDWLTSTRGHPIDIVVTRMCGFTLIYLAGLARPDAGVNSVAVSVMLIVTNLWGFFIHSNVKFRFGWLENLIATPAFHRWHHTADCHRDHNYASTLPMFDRLFGTWYLPNREQPLRFGVDGATHLSFFGQLLKPFVPLETRSGRTRQV
jgi:sterol desaturase/sphingolipid hydroxylase (fatty acid hydroxylase superfamily)